MQETNKMYFKLHADCIPVKGYLRSLIYDVGRNNFRLIPNELYEIITIHKREPIERIKEIYEDEGVLEEYYKFLIENEFGMYCEESDFDLFPELELTFQIPSIITNAIIDINTFSNHNLPSIFDQLRALQCRNVQIRCYSDLDVDFLKNLVNASLDYDFTCIELVLKYNEAFTLELFLELIAYSALTTVLLHSVPERLVQSLTEDARKAKALVIFSIESVNDQSHCGVVSPAYFSPGINFLAESKKFNSCLNRKISVDVDGNIKNCPSCTKNYGHINDTALEKVVFNEEFRKVWGINKDQIETCKICEFRYMCQDCRVYLTKPENLYSKPLKCSYNPITARWDE